MGEVEVSVLKQPRTIHSRQFHDALVEAGVIRAGDRVRRIVIDAQYGEAVVIHVERFGDERLLDVVRTLDGVEIREGKPAGAKEPADTSWIGMTTSG